MARVNKIFITLFIVLSLFPFAEYLLFIFQNPNSNITLDTSSSVRTINLNDGYVIISLPDKVSSFQDYVILNYSYGSYSTDTVIPDGISFTIYKFILIIVKNSNTIYNSPLILDIFVFSCLLIRSVYIACSLFFIYLITLPVMLPLTIFRRKNNVT